MAPTLGYWLQGFIVKFHLSFLSSGLSLKEPLNIFSPWTFLNTAEHAAVPEYFASEAPSWHKHIHRQVTGILEGCECGQVVGLEILAHAGGGGWRDRSLPVMTNA